MQKFANSTPLQLTMRELRILVISKQFWVGFLAVIFVLSISGPFGTLAQLGFLDRLFYWTVTGFVTFFLGITTSFLVGLSLNMLGAHEFVARAIGALIAGLPVAAFVWYFNSWIFSSQMTGFWMLALYCCGISIAVTLLFYLIEPKDPIQPDGSTPPKQTSLPFFDRLDAKIGRDLISLQSQDHYTQITTTAGSQLLLLRLTDACSELAPYSGLRVHRSWWVARDHIIEMIRKNSRYLLKLSNGEEIPVGRTFINEVRAALDTDK